MRENAGSGRDGEWGERESMSACETKRGAQGGGEGEVRVCVCVCVCVCVFSIVIILIT